MKTQLLATAFALSLSGAASAASIDYNLWTGLGVSNNSNSSSITTTVNGVTLTIAATGNSSDKVAYRTNAGLGVCINNCSGLFGDSPEMGSDLIKGEGREVLTFTFSEAVYLDQIGFYLFENNTDKARLTYNGTSLDISNATANNAGKPITGFSEYNVGGSPLVTSFSIAARGSVTSFRIADLSVSTVAPPMPTVPVPGALWLMGSALMGLAGVARRRSDRA